MYRFIDLRGQDVAARFAFYDTGTEQFLSFDGQQTFDSLPDLQHALLGHFDAHPAAAGTGLERRLKALLPDWALQEPAEPEIPFDEVRQIGVSELQHAVSIAVTLAVPAVQRVSPLPSPGPGALRALADQISARLWESLTRRQTISQVAAASQLATLDQHREELGECYPALKSAWQHLTNARQATSRRIRIIFLRAAQADLHQARQLLPPGSKPWCPASQQLFTADDQLRTLTAELAQQSAIEGLPGATAISESA